LTFESSMLYILPKESGMSLMRLAKKLDAAISDAKRAKDVAGAAIEHTNQYYGLRLLRAGLLWGSTFAISRGLLELPDLDRTVRILIALAPVPLFLWFLWIWMKGVGAMDELQPRIELEALSFAFPICVDILMTLGLAQVPDTAVNVPVTSRPVNSRAVYWKSGMGGRCRLSVFGCQYL